MLDLGLGNVGQHRSGAHTSIHRLSTFSTLLRPPPILILVFLRILIPVPIPIPVLLPVLFQISISPAARPSLYLGSSRFELGRGKCGAGWHITSLTTFLYPAFRQNGCEQRGRRGIAFRITHRAPTLLCSAPRCSCRRSKVARRKCGVVRRSDCDTNLASLSTDIYGLCRGTARARRQ